MSWKQFAASVIQSLAWPTVVLILAIVLRKSLVDLILRLKKFKHKETELEFGEQLAKIEQEVPAPKVTTAAPEAQSIEDLADVSPRAVILDAWATLEILIYKKVAALGKIDAKTKRGTFPEMLRVLRENGTLDWKTLTSLTEMRQLRNRVAHAAPDEVEIEPSEAKRYWKLATTIALNLR